jgi:hypothetical protein
MDFGQAMNRSLRGKILLLFGQADRHLAWRQFRLLQRHVDDLEPEIVGDTVPDAIRSGGTNLRLLGNPQNPKGHQECGAGIS